jgi:hypothetical protein
MQTNDEGGEAEVVAMEGADGRLKSSGKKMI